MHPQNNPQNSALPAENAVLGALGAFLLALVGGVVYYVLNMVGYLAALSGLVAVVCAIKGYALFAKTESRRGIIISVVMAAVVIVLAWYFCFCTDMVAVYEEAYRAGEIDFTFTLPEYLLLGFYDLSVNPSAFVDLFLSLALGAVGCGGYVSSALRRREAISAQQAAQARTQALADAQAAQAAQAAERAAEAETVQGGEAEAAQNGEAEEEK